MIARVATFSPLPNGLDEAPVDQLRETIRETPGYVAGFHLRDPETQKALSVTIFENMNALAHVREALARRPDDTKVGIDPDSVEFFEAHAF